MWMSYDNWVLAHIALFCKQYVVALLPSALILKAYHHLISSH